VSVAAGATPIAYNETTSGDLSASLPGILVTLDVGTNTVSGSQYDNFELSERDRDSFAFTVPSGTEVTQISYSIDYLISGSEADTVYDLDNGSVGLGFADIELTDALSVNLFSTALPLGPGTYGLNNTFLSNPSDGWTSGYTWTFNVVSTTAPVPEPATLLLMGTGLVAGGLRRARKRSRG
jgi:hypothetical protein